MKDYKITMTNFVGGGETFSIIKAESKEEAWKKYCESHEFRLGLVPKSIEEYHAPKDSGPYFIF